MKAIEINHYLEGAKPILHTDVVEVESPCRNRQFECKHCGRNWREEINAMAQIIESKEVEDNIEEYYPGYQICTKPKHQ